MKEWYQCTGKETLERLLASAEGLSQQQALERRKQYGENQLLEKRKKPAWRVFLEQFQDLLVLILIGAAVISMLTDNVESTVVIFAVITLNAALGTIQHEKTQKTLESLKNLSAPTAAVLRDGQKLEIPSRQVVPGDILYLETGDLVVADGRVLEAVALQVNESSLTGESGSVFKQEKPLLRQAPLADRSSMVYSGSLVTAGRGTVVVTATGMNTEIGNIAVMMNDSSEKKTPLQISLDQFGSRLAAAILVICLVVFLLSLYRGMAVLDSLMFAVALAVAAIPEALGSIVTIVQAMGTQKMAREQAIIKDLKAVESLGCVSVICTDKTGTLTQNRMTVEQVALLDTLMSPRKLRLENPGHRLFLEACILNNNATIKEPEGGKTAEGRPPLQGIGDATELALLQMVRGIGLDPGYVKERFLRIQEIPFDSRRRMMSVVEKEPGGEEILFVKGASDILLKHCSKILEHGNPRPLTARDRERLQKYNLACTSQGLRVLSFAYKPMSLNGKERTPGGLENDLIFLGLAAMADPLRPEAAAAVADARRAGIRPVMITGDHKATAMAVAEKAGIWKPGELAVSGSELNELSEKELDKNLEQISVYARVSPEHKLRIVRAWQRKGKIVAMTGDGVNDAPALKQADIGVAMGRNGTDVSKDAAAMILADDNFATIIKAVANGRNVYRNIRNAIQFLLSGNMAGILCVLYTTIMGLPMPFAPVHLLFINLLTDSLPAIAIGMEQPERGLLDMPPRNPWQGILTVRFLREVLFQGALIAVCTMGAYQVGLTGTWNGLFQRLSGEAWQSAKLASTMAFSTLTLARLFHGFNCRSRRSFLKLGVFSNIYTVMAFEAGVFLLAAVLFVPGLRTLFAASDLTVNQLVSVAVFAVFPTIVIQALKLFRETFMRPAADAPL